MVDITANATVFPSANDIAEVEKEGRFATEQRFADKYTAKWVGDHVETGFLLPATDPDLTITVPTGTAFIDGKRIIISATTDVLLVASQTNHIFLQLNLDGNSDVDGVDIVTNTTGAVPSNSVKIGRAITDGSSVTSTKDERPLNPILANSVGPDQLNNFFGAGANASQTITSDSFVDLTSLSVPIAQNEKGFSGDGLSTIRIVAMFNGQAIGSAAPSGENEIRILAVGDDAGDVILKTLIIKIEANTGTETNVTSMVSTTLSVLEGWTIKAQARRIAGISAVWKDMDFIVYAVE